MNHCSQPHKKEDNFFSPLEHYFEEISEAEDGEFAPILTKPDKFVEPKTEFMKITHPNELEKKMNWAVKLLANGELPVTSAFCKCSHPRGVQSDPTLTVGLN